jgi:hypothetical protein
MNIDVYIVYRYQSTCIELEVVLVAQLRVQIQFHMSINKATGFLAVDNTYVELKQKNDINLTEGIQIYMHMNIYIHICMYVCIFICK